MDDAIRLIVGFVLGLGVLGTFLVYLLLMPEKAEKVAGWLSGVAARVFRTVDRSAVAYKVQGAVNSMRAEMQKSAPGLLEKRLKIKWANADEAETQLKDGEVLVVMQRSRHTEENIAHAVMAYLPKALLARARPYVDRDRMRAADLVIAKALFAHEKSPAGALDVFFEKHLDPARSESAELKTKIAELDDLDMEGWLTRVLLAEYQILGGQLHPSEPDETCVSEAERLARWLFSLSARAPGDDSLTLTYRGRYFKVAVIFVARRELLERKGLAPYRRRAKRYLYTDKMDAIYLMGRDETIASVKALADELEKDVRVASITRFDYALRSDFKMRKLNRDRAAVICLRRRQGGSEMVSDEAEDDDAELPEEIYDPSLESANDQLRDVTA